GTLGGKESQEQLPSAQATSITGAQWIVNPSPKDVRSLPSTPMLDSAGSSTAKPLTLPQRMKLWITGKLPALKSILGGDASSKQQTGAGPQNAALVSSPTRRSSALSLSGPLQPSEAEISFLKQIQRFVLGQQRHTTTAAV